MDTLYFLLCIVGIFWLALWSIRDPSRRSRLWWPFAMKDDAAAPPSEPPAAPPGPPRPGRRQVPPARRQVPPPRRRVA